MIFRNGLALKENTFYPECKNGKWIPTYQRRYSFLHANRGMIDDQKVTTSFSFFKDATKKETLVTYQDLF
jgi:hypothetical protein